MMSRGHLRLLGSVLTPAGLVLGLLVVEDRVEERGRHFYETGKEIVTNLERLARLVQAKDVASLGEFYSPGFRGERLGLNTMDLVEEKDGVRRLRFRSDGDTPT